MSPHKPHPICCRLWRYSSPTRRAWSFVMIAALGYHYFIVGHFVHESVLLRKTPRPVALPLMLEWLRAAGAFERCAKNLLNERVYLAKDLGIVLGPEDVILKRIGVEANGPFHSKAEGSTSFMFRPASMSAITLFRCSRFAGLLRRYSVSSCSWTEISMRLSRNIARSLLRKLSSSSLVFRLKLVTIIV